MLLHFSRHPVWSAALIATIIGGCSGPLEPARESPGRVTESWNVLVGPGALPLDPSEAGIFYPLDLGNQWHYEQIFSAQVLPDGAPPEPPFVSHSTIDRELICVESRANARYVIEQSRQVQDSPFGGTQTFVSWVRYREDKSGLYEADVPLGEPPACNAARSPAHASKPASGRMDSREAGFRFALSSVPDAAHREIYRAAWVELQRRFAAIELALGRSGEQPGPLSTTGLLAGEITRLRYPLRPGTSWVIRDEPLFTAAVEGMEMLELAVGPTAAYRIRIEIPGILGGHDRVHVWFARSGFLKLEVHVEGEATDSNGQRIGIVISETTEELTGLSLVGGGRS